MTRANFAAAATHDRRHDDPQHVAEHAKGLHPRRARTSAAFQKSPDKLTLRRCARVSAASHLAGLQAATINPIMCALRFFYGTTLGRKGVAEHIPLARKADTLPAVLTQDEVVRLLKAVPDLKMRTPFITIYAAGFASPRRSRLPHGYRQRAHGHPRPARQRPQGPLRDAVRAAARHPARLLAVCASATLGCSRAPIPSAR